MKKRISVAAIFILIVALVAGRADAAEAPRTEGACSADLTLGTAVTILNEGQGPDLILIPGLSTPRAVWEPTAARLKAKYRLHIVQIRGFGDAAGPNAEGPVLPTVVEDVRGFIEDCIVGQDKPAPAIIGHSMGGLTGLMVAAEAPDRVGRLMIVDAVPFIGTIFGTASVDAIRPQAEAMAAMLRAQYGQPKPEGPVTDPGSAGMVGGMSNTPSGRIAIAGWMRSADPRVTAQTLYDVMTTDMRGELPKVKAPVTLLYAQDDSAMPPERAKAAFEPQYAGTPQFGAQMVPGSRHFIMLDQPEIFARAVDAFLAK
ncbi:alpha/beta hydrolase [Sphingopyxis sp.]|uniref:alpha/beta fold hydrolase n=1 Tax=Sphingopyxis sp. TaxID=1908224 RepID=UPI002EDB4D11